MERQFVEEIRKLAERVAADKLTQRASEIDQNPAFPWENICALRQAGFHRLITVEGEGTQIIGKTVIGWGFFGAAAISTGIARTATELAIKHAKERTIGGQPIGAHQAVQFMITDMVMGTEASEALLPTCASQADLLPDTAILNGLKEKLFASENAVDVANKAIQVMGGGTDTLAIMSSNGFFVMLEV